MGKSSAARSQRKLISNVIQLYCKVYCISFDVHLVAPKKLRKIAISGFRTKNGGKRMRNPSVSKVRQKVFIQMPFSKYVCGIAIVGHFSTTTYYNVLQRYSTLLQTLQLHHKRCLPVPHQLTDDSRGLESLFKGGGM
jgi:hypothetical protein